MTVTPQSLVQEGALFAVNHSGGKDSQAMLIQLLNIVPKSQLLVVHASLGEVEWPGAEELAEEQAAAADIPFIVARSRKTFFEMVQHRFTVRPGPNSPCWPSAKNRQCTSDLKRDPIEREVRRFAKLNGVSKIVSCMGIRAAESTGRAKRPAFRRNERGSISGRDWYEWLPIKDLSTDEVFATISAANQVPHYAYGLGNDRLSCVFCIMGSRNDLRNGARLNPDLLQKYIEIEKRTGYTMHQSRVPLAVLAGLTPAAELAPTESAAESSPGGCA